MFRKTQILLTLQYAAVFMLIVSCLGAFLYWYMEKQSFAKIDHSLLLSVQAEEERLRGTGISAPSSLDPLIGKIIWDENNRVVYTEAPFSSIIENLHPEKTDGEVHTLEAEGFTFRYLAVSVQTSEGPWVVQSIRNIDAEMMTLRDMRNNIIIGCALSGVVALLAGYFLGKRALIPIRQAWEVQQQFVADASHELRTPLTVIQTRTELLLQHPHQTVQEKSDDISTIYRETRRVRRLVNDLLTLARSDSNQLELDRQAFDVSELLSEVGDHFSELAELEGITFEIHIQSRLFCNGDRERIHQLLVILLDNAVKFTPSGGAVYLSCGKKGSQLFIEVRDTGVGISEKDLPRIFDRFYRGDQARGRRDGGTGLGLSIAQWIVEKHGGSISAKSNSEGTTFTVKLAAVAGT